MAEIEISDLSNSTDDNEGTGVFDVLIKNVGRHIEKQYEEGRIKGSDYSTVYMGALQSVLQQSVAFLLGEQQADKQADLLSQQITELTLDTARKNDLLEAQLEKEWGYIVTRAVDGSIVLGASTGVGLVDKKTVDVNNKGLDTIASTVLKGSQNSEQLADTIRKDSLTTEQLIKIQEEVDLIQSQDLTEAEKTKLLLAQTIGFKSDTLQKVLAQLLKAWSLNQSLTPTTPPDAVANPSIDALKLQIVNLANTSP